MVQLKLSGLALEFDACLTTERDAQPAIRARAEFLGFVIDLDTPYAAQACEHHGVGWAQIGHGEFHVAGLMTQPCDLALG